MKKEKIEKKKLPDKPKEKNPIIEKPKKEEPKEVKEVNPVSLPSVRFTIKQDEFEKMRVFLQAEEIETLLTGDDFHSISEHEAIANVYMSRLGTVLASVKQAQSQFKRDLVNSGWTSARAETESESVILASAVNEPIVSRREVDYLRTDMDARQKICKDRIYVLTLEYRSTNAPVTSKVNDFPA